MLQDRTMECFLFPGTSPAIIPTCILSAAAILAPVGSAIDMVEAFLLDGLLLPKKLFILLSRPVCSSLLFRQRLYRSIAGWDFL